MLQPLCKQFTKSENWQQSAISYPSNATLHEVNGDVQTACQILESDIGRGQVELEFHKDYDAGIEAWKHNMTANLARHGVQGNVFGL